MNTARSIKIFVISFVLLAIFFSFLAGHISTFTAKCLSLTGELQIYAAGPEAEDQISGGAAGNKKSAAPKPSAAVKEIDYTRQVLETGLPNTETPNILALDSILGIDKIISSAPLFPNLRLYTGQEWNKEKTEIRAATDGITLFFKIFCHDSNPENLVTEFSMAEGPQNVWRDDSIEIFITENSHAEEYYQFVASASGKTQRYDMKKRKEDPRFGSSLASSYSVDELCRVNVNGEGYSIEWEIPLSNMNFKKDDIIENGFNLQIVRNYRGQTNDPARASLQLFPVYIYGDKRFGTCNHHHFAFQPVKMINQ
jgi:hypothetical protein